MSPTGGRRFVRAPFIQANGTFALEADVDQCPFVVQFDDAAVDDFALSRSLAVRPRAHPEANDFGCLPPVRRKLASSLQR